MDTGPRHQLNKIPAPIYRAYRCYLDTHTPPATILLLHKKAKTSLFSLPWWERVRVRGIIPGFNVNLDTIIYMLPETMLPAHKK